MSRSIGTDMKIKSPTCRACCVDSVCLKKNVIFPDDQFFWILMPEAQITSTQKKKNIEGVAIDIFVETCVKSSGSLFFEASHGFFKLHGHELNSFDGLEPKTCLLQVCKIHLWTLLQHYRWVACCGSPLILRYFRCLPTVDACICAMMRLVFFPHTTVGVIKELSGPCLKDFGTHFKKLLGFLVAMQRYQVHQSCSTGLTSVLGDLIGFRCKSWVEDICRRLSIQKSKQLHLWMCFFCGGVIPRYTPDFFETAIGSPYKSPCNWQGKTNHLPSKSPFFGGIPNLCIFPGWIFPPPQKHKKTI